jgi:GTP-binding protein Era
MVKRSGFVAIIGRPNVGKSTLMNRILGQKISITSRRPQTTRHRILGIKTTSTAQTVYLDTPGIHKQVKNEMNRLMNRSAKQSMLDVDVIVMVLEGTRFTDEDEQVMQQVCRQEVPVILAINKLDKVKQKDTLLPYIAQFSEKACFTEIVPVSAKTGNGVEELEHVIENLLPQGQAFFPEEQVTDKSERFLAAEIVREKLMRLLGQELPYALTVEIEKFSDENNQLDIAALIWVEREGQKKIVIGKKGEKLKEIGIAARQDMERLFGTKVFLQLWVRVKSGWSDDIRALRSLGYGDDE